MQIARVWTRQSRTPARPACGRPATARSLSPFVRAAG